MCKVYVVRKQKIKEEMACKWGTPLIITDNDDDTNYGLEPDRIKLQIVKDLIKFDPKEDFLLLDGQLIYNCVGTSIISAFHNSFSTLIWRKNTYCNRLIEIPEIERAEDKRKKPIVWATNEAHFIKGDIQYFFEKDSDVDTYDSTEITNHVVDKISEFEQKDFLILSGSILLNIITTSCILKKNGRVKLKLMDHVRDKYVIRDLVSSKEHYEALANEE